MSIVVWSLPRLDKFAASIALAAKLGTSFTQARGVEYASC
jgi:hypothetical protein